MKADKLLGDLELDEVLEYLETGDIEKAPENVRFYIQTMDMIWRLHKRRLDFPNNEAVISHLVLVHNFSRLKARQMLTSTLEYFYEESRLSKETWKNIAADLGIKTFTSAIRVAKNARDFKDAFSIIINLGQLLGWNLPDAEKPDETFLSQVQIATTDIEMFGLEPVNRPQLAKLVDALPISDKMKEAAMLEIDKVPFKNIVNNPRHE